MPRDADPEETRRWEADMRPNEIRSVQRQLVRAALLETLEKFGCQAPPSVTKALAALGEVESAAEVLVRERGAGYKHVNVTDVATAARSLASLAAQTNAAVSQVTLYDERGEATSLLLYVRDDPNTVKRIQRLLDRE